MAEELRKARRHPPWLKVRAPFGERVHELKSLMKGLQLNTVCQEAMCPNMGECWSHGVATFMILGDVCTRGCRYCAVAKGKPAALDGDEPERVAEAVQAMGLKHAVITSVDRDDVQDGGAAIFAQTIRQIRKRMSKCIIEVLIPDFQGSDDALRTVLDAQPEILNHNIETVPRLYREARGGGKYDVSLRVLENSRKWAPEIVTKTGMMLGLGEEADEIRQVMQDLVDRKVSILTLGQYLRPTNWHLPVARYYHPDEFRHWKNVGESLGFEHVESGPLVRSSYLADRQFEALRGK
ncbi:MAG: lipoyl synthase [Acidobacteriota bacterium]